jgi:glycosyltransferase involved in cell wall biosynthesis
LLFEGLADTVVDAHALVHARDMRRQGIVDFEVWAVACSGAAHARSLERLEAARSLSEGAVRLLRGVRRSLPGSELANARRLGPRLRGLDAGVDLVHARTDYAAAVASYLRRWRRFELVWDARGDAEAEFRHRYAGWNPLRAMLRGYMVSSVRRRVRLASRTFDRAIFVTEALRQRLGGSQVEARSEVIPCAADEELFFFSPRLRAETRAAEGYPESARVVVYSGGLAAYQCYGGSVELFRRLRCRDPELRLLVVTPRPEAARPALEGLPEGSFQLRSARLGEVNALLNAADYGLLLREADPLNAVASPTKFAEYGLAGLPVVMADTVPDSYRMAKEVGNLCEYRNGAVELVEGIDRARVSAAYRERLSRSAVRERFRRVYASPDLAGPC